MLIVPQCLLILVSLSLAAASPDNSEAPSSSGSALYPPGLQPLIARANALLSAGSFADAARVYTEAIEQSPIDYALYYKRGTAYFSVSRFPQSLADFDKVLELSRGGFDKALLMQGRIYVKTGSWELARKALSGYVAKLQKSKSAAEKEKAKEPQDLLFRLSEAESAYVRAQQSRNAGLNQACADAASDALREATHAPHVRELRAECALAAGDVQGAVGDMMYVVHALYSANLFLTYV